MNLLIVHVDSHPLLKKPIGENDFLY